MEIEKSRVDQTAQNIAEGYKRFGGSLICAGCPFFDEVRLCSEPSGLQEMEDGKVYCPLPNGKEVRLEFIK